MHSLAHAGSRGQDVDGRRSQALVAPGETGLGAAAVPGRHGALAGLALHPDAGEPPAPSPARGLI